MTDDGGSTKKPDQEELALRRRMRDVLRELDRLAQDHNLVYMSEEGPIVIDEVAGRLVFEVYDDPDDDNEQPTYLLARTTDDQLK